MDAGRLHLDLPLARSGFEHGGRRLRSAPFSIYARVMDPLHATIEEFAAEGYTHVSCHCPRAA
jgi:hypothetical protein